MSLFPSWLAPNLLLSMRRGIEKEGLRFFQHAPALSLHPKEFGHKLVHPKITTDYSENLLELITAPHATIADALNELGQIHAFVAHTLQQKGELLWALSMPAGELSDTHIPLADYGNSFDGRFKTLYRRGLGVRYGRKMQSIAGIHYNLSFGDDLFLAWQKAQGNSNTLSAFKNAKYLGMIRNVKRFLPIMLYVFGASPVISGSFAVPEGFDRAGNDYLKPYGTSLRMGRFGYTNSVQSDLGIYYNDLDEYVTHLKRATSTPHNAFSALGKVDAAGVPTQINDHILQIENELYSPVRPKQIPKAGETPSDALDNRGIGYVELRAVDINPFLPLGIDTKGAAFLEVFALFCLLSDAPYLHQDDERTLVSLYEAIAQEGRGDVSLSLDAQALLNADDPNWHTFLLECLEAMTPCAQALDAAYGTYLYQDALAHALHLAKHPDTTPAGRLLDALDDTSRTPLLQAGLSFAKAHQDILTPLVDDALRVHFLQLASLSSAQAADMPSVSDVAFAQLIAQGVTHV